MGRRRCLDHAVAVSVGILRAAGDDHPELRRRHVETFRHVLANQDLVQILATSRDLGLDDLLDPLQVRRKALARPRRPLRPVLGRALQFSRDRCHASLDLVEHEGTLLCRHYGMTPTRNNPGVSHENGSVEAAHGHLKRDLRNAFELRGSRDFADLAAYQGFLQEFTMRKNAARTPDVAVERTACQRLPTHKTTDFSTAIVTVTRSGTICVRNVLYTVPSRLAGCRLKVHIYDDRLVCHLGATEVFFVNRRNIRPRNKSCLNQTRLRLRRPASPATKRPSLKTVSDV
jgi:hypothetical protein